MELLKSNNEWSIISHKLLPGIVSRDHAELRLIPNTNQAIAVGHVNLTHRNHQIAIFTIAIAENRVCLPSVYIGTCYICSEPSDLIVKYHNRTAEICKECYDIVCEYARKIKRTDKFNTCVHGDYLVVDRVWQYVMAREIITIPWVTMQAPITHIIRPITHGYLSIAQ